MNEEITKRESMDIRVGQYLAIVEVDMIYTDGGWSPCLSAEDTRKLGEVRRALGCGDLERAKSLAQVYTLVAA